MGIVIGDWEISVGTALLWLLFGLVLLVWGFRHRSIRKEVDTRTPKVAPYGKAATHQVAPAPSIAWTAKTQEFIAIVGGLVSIILGILTIIEKLAK